MNVVNKKKRNSFMIQGIIALDIDGTLVTQHQPLSVNLSSFLEEISHKKWVILFATGRTVRWSMEHLSRLPFPFYLAPYNGACLFSFPERQMIDSALLEPKEVMKLAPFVDQFGAIVYEAGGEERIFYTERRFSTMILDHLHSRQEAQQEQWIAINTLKGLPNMRVAGVRFFLSPEAALMLGETIHSTTSLRAPTMKDSFNEMLRIVQVTARNASKGHALRSLKTRYPDVTAIAAGDDMNDLDLLSEADIGIAMASAPQALQEIAAITASPDGADPIIAALKQAIGMAQER
jgi:HAD superfamily hydrolase (TIGR01484 family)